MLEDKNLGEHFRYISEGDRWFDVYLYPIPGVNVFCVNECAVQAVDYETDQFSSQLAVLVEHGYYDSVKVQEDRTRSVSIDETTYHVRHLVLDAVQKGEQKESHWVLLSRYGYYVKFRFSAEPGSVEISTIDDLVDSLATELIPVFQCNLGPSTSSPIEISVALSETPSEVVIATDSALKDLGLATQFAVPSYGRWVTAPSFRDPLADPNDNSTLGQHPGVQSMLLITQTENDSTQFTVSSRALCSLGEATGDDDTESSEGVVATQSTIMITARMTELLEALKTPYEVPKETDVFEVISGNWQWEDEMESCATDPDVHSFSAARDTMYLTTLSTDSTSESQFEVTTYVIQKYDRGSVTGAIIGETRLTDDGVPVVWDLVLKSENSFCWHRTDWNDGACTKDKLRCPVGESR